MTFYLGRIFNIEIDIISPPSALSHSPRWKWQDLGSITGVRFSLQRCMTCCLLPLTLAWQNCFARPLSPNTVSAVGLQSWSWRWRIWSRRSLERTRWENSRAWDGDHETGGYIEEKCGFDTFAFWFEIWQQWRHCRQSRNVLLIFTIISRRRIWQKWSTAWKYYPRTKTGLKLMINRRRNFLLKFEKKKKEILFAEK